MSGIEVKNLSLVYEQEETIFQNLHFHFPSGQITSIIGPSGCGKSSLLSLVAGLMEPAAGSILLNGKPITGPGLDRGVVFQKESLFPWMTAGENIAFALQQRNKGLSKGEYRRLAQFYLEQVHLPEEGKKFPGQLSGGQQQRVAIARMLALDSPVFLMDEPFGALDAHTRHRLQDLLLQLWQEKEERKTIILVTHDVEEALYLSDHIVVMAGKPSGIKAHISIDHKRPRKREDFFQEKEIRQLQIKLTQLLEPDEEHVIQESVTRETVVSIERRRVAR